MAWCADAMRGWPASACAGALAAIAYGAAHAADATPLQHVLQPAGPQAAHIHSLWHVLLWVCSAVFVAVLVAFGFALWRAPRATSTTPADTQPAAAGERRATRSVASAVVGSTLLLVFLIVASVFTDAALAKLSLRDAVHIQVTANQWWWEARYEHPQAGKSFTTANELHVPVGRPVVLTLQSNDVIHSLWVPALHGKKDLIPGRTATMHFQADKAGLYRGQCAEFCGFQHSLMAFTVQADAPATFDAWADQQRMPAAEPQGALPSRGRELFLSTSCVMCHTVQGTSAGGRRGPDLTHVAQRRSIAAGTLPNTPDNLLRWLRDPQKVKPGTNMPPSDLADADLQALVAYLRSLQ